jgi:outer membrane protein OmpA-like peptidoglycan-associated protein/opacity protein-like surface antigen
MPSKSQNTRRHLALRRFSALATVCSFAVFAAAQEQPAPKWELFGGYSFVYPGASVHGLLPGGLLPVGSDLESNPRGAGASVTYNFNRWFGLTGDISGDLSSGESGVPDRIDDAEFYNLSAGPKITFRGRHFSPFLEALVGGHRLTSEVFGHDNEVGFMGGGGLDLNVNRHLALRLLRGDYVFSNHQYGPSSIVPKTHVTGVRLQSGVVLMLGGETIGPPPSATCAVNPGEVMVGEPASATVASSGFNPRHKLDYSWSNTGGRIVGTDNTARINTASMAGGSYTVTVHVGDPRMKNGGVASCMATLIVKELPKHPPSISCSASPSTVHSGTSATVSCTCTSPDSVPVTVGSWTASGGRVSSSGGNTESLDTSGVSDGLITVSGTCTDLRGLNTSAAAQVMVENPPPVSPEFTQLENRLALHSIYFPTAQPRVTNPDGGLLESQRKTLVSLADDFRKYLESKPDARLTLEGHADPRASVEYNQALSERRVERVKSFLIEHGVPAANIDTKAFGEQKNLTSDQVKDAVEKNSELTPEERQKVLSHLETILLASNRRVDVTLSTTGQRSIREYPFNASDSLTLLQQEGTHKTARPARKHLKPAQN